MTVVRAQDDTNASGHNAGAAIYPIFTADEADEANQIASVMTTKGDVIGTDGSSINRLGIGTNTHVLQADSTATNGFKWGQVAEGGIADSAVTSAKIAVGAIVNDDINASAGIVDTKLATIATASKVSNSATTAASANTASAIVARDASGNFTAGTITATTFVGALTGTASGNLTSGGALGTPSSGTLTNCTFPTLNQNTTGNAATATLATTATTANNALAIANGTVTSAKLSGIYGLTTADIAVTMTTSYADYTVTIPNSRSYFDIVSIRGQGGTNDIVYVESYALGEWSGNLSPNQAIVRAKLGNAVASNVGYIRFWFAN